MKVTNVISDDEGEIERLQYLADIAEAIYVEGLTQMEVADRFSLARPTVSRLIAEARQKGIVEFKIHRVFQTVPELEGRICETYGIRAADVVVLPERDRAFGGVAFGRFAARSLHPLLLPNAVLGVTLGTTVSTTVDALCKLEPLSIKVVQLCGSVGADDPALDAHAIVEKLSRAYGCEGIYFHAPFLVESKEVRDSLRRNPTNRLCLELGKNATVALVGIGSMDTVHSSLYRGGHVPEDQVSRMQKLGVIGDVGGFNFDAEGRHVPDSGSFWASGTDFGEFLGIPLRVAVTTGAHKVRQIDAALRGGLINHLITDRATATALLPQEAA
jgi:deoxyribonucleoside regulator